MAHIEELFDYLKIRGGSLTEAEIRMMLHRDDWTGESFLSSKERLFVGLGYAFCIVLFFWICGLMGGIGPCDDCGWE